MINVSVVKFCRFTEDSMDVFLSQINFNKRSLNYAPLHR